MSTVLPPSKHSLWSYQSHHAKMQIYSSYHDFPLSHPQRRSNSSLEGLRRSLIGQVLTLICPFMRALPFPSVLFIPPIWNHIKAMLHTLQILNKYMLNSQKSYLFLILLKDPHPGRVFICDCWSFLPFLQVSLRTFFLTLSHKK